MINEMRDVLATVVASSAVFYRLITWIQGFKIDSALVTLTSLIGLIYLLMKVYDQYLITKKRKEDERRNEG